MPSLYYTVEASGVNILKTVTDQVVVGLLDELDLYRYFENSVYILNPFSALSQYDDGSNTPTLNKNRCDVDVNFVLDKAQVPWPVETPHTTTAYGVRTDHKGKHSPIFLDEKAGILIEHYTVACALDMDFRLNFQTFDDANKAFDRIKSKYHGSLIQAPFDIAFSYPVSASMWQFLVAAYEAKTDYANKTVLDYINDMKVSEMSFDVRKSQLTKEDADKALMVRVQQLGCLAQLTMDQSEPDVNRLNELPDSFHISFKLVFQFGRPNLVAIHTPVSIDNTVLPYSFFERKELTHHHNNYVNGIYQDLMVNEFAKRTYGNFTTTSQFVRLPVYDDWFTADSQYIFHEYRPFLVAHFTLDGETTTIDLKQLDDLTLHSVVQSILKETGNSVFDYGGLFHIGVFAGELRLGQELVSISDDLILTIHSSRPDKVYHLIISETTALNKTDPKWDDILIRYRYFFPMSIERNIEHLINKRYFYIDYDNGFIALIRRLWDTGKLKPILKDMVLAGEDTNEIFSYTQNVSQLADYMAYTQSRRKNYTLPKQDPQDPDSPPIEIIADYYETITSVEGRSLMVAFIEQCLLKGELELDNVPRQYLRPDTTAYPYANIAGGNYGFNTPIRIFKYNYRT